MENNKPVKFTIDLFVFFYLYAVKVTYSSFLFFNDACLTHAL